MVSTERMQRAQVEEELQNVRQEREALKGALRIVEGENSSLRSGASIPPSAHHASISNASAPSRDRPRALTIDTDKAGGQVTDVQTSGIDLTQTPSTSELPSRSGGQTPVSTVDTRPSIKAAVGGPEDLDSWSAANGGSQTQHSQKDTHESEGSKYDHLPIRTLTFGM